MNGKEVAGSGTIEKVTSDWKNMNLNLTQMSHQTEM